MIAHVAEVWVGLVVAFIGGCLVGTLLFRLIARSSYKSTQLKASNALAGVGRRMRHQAGMARGPRYPYRPAAPPPVALPEPSPAAQFDDDLTASATPEPDVEPEEDWLPEAVDVEAPDDDGTFGDVDLAERTSPQPIARSPSSGPAPRPPEVSDRRRIGGPAIPPRVPDQPSIRPPADGDRSESRPPLLVAADDATQSRARPSLESRRPATLLQPRNGVPDNLQRIRGIGERNEVRLNQLGIFHFSQIASWTPAEVRWIGEQLAFPERIEGDDWVGQAIVLASGGETGFTKSAERRRARRRIARDGEHDAEPEDEG
jgi:predicted flap endonuclease-1-like 5' DNA nuclease